MQSVDEVQGHTGRHLLAQQGLNFLPVLFAALHPTPKVALGGFSAL